MKPRHQKLTGECQSVREILARVGDKWTVLVVGLLGGGPMRFSELRRAIAPDAHCGVGVIKSTGIALLSVPGLNGPRLS